MKIFPVICALIIGCSAGLSPAAEEGTNKIATLPELTLAQALRTNVASTFKIAPAWTGQCAVVHATGAFTAPKRPEVATNRYDLKFDLAVVAPKNPVGHVGPKGVATSDTNGGYRALHSIRDSLPTDPAIKSASTQTALQKALGPAQGFPQATGYGPIARTQLTWSLLSVKETTLDTLQVNAVVEKGPGSGEPRVESLEILRGAARPEIKAPKKT